MSLPSVLPIFPLPNVVLFPRVLLPLHIFEPRYRQMVSDVAVGDELIGMILLRSCGEQPPGGDCDVYGSGCAGKMIRRVELPDGRSNILLQGIREFTWREQFHDRPYRTAAVEWRAPAGRFRLGETRREALVSRIRAYTSKKPDSELRILDDPTLGDEMLVNLFAFALDLPIVEKQSLLEAEALEDRAERLLEVLEFHVMEQEFAPGAEALKIRVQ